jgi:phosphatidylinositol kinase/protein kinase (PI-3  family)
VIRGVNQLTLPLSQYCFLATNQMLLQIGSADIPRKFIRRSIPAIRHRIERAKSPFDEMVKRENPDLFARIEILLKLIDGNENKQTSEMRNWERQIRGLQDKFQQLAQIRENKLSELAPELSTWTDHNFIVFGAGLEVGIESFFATVDVIPSKQRPRKLRIRGTDGH